ncbi:MAG: serine/threonine-protein kinase, partial [Myxococcota bacterium]
MDDSIDAAVAGQGDGEKPRQPYTTTTILTDPQMQITNRTLDRSDGMVQILGAGTNIAQYELIRELGRGGMGVVFLARDTRLGRRVAIKFLSRRRPNSIERFVAEARITARCEHDNIVAIHDVGEAHNYLYMVLEYLRGITLRTWLKQRWGSTDDPREEPKPAEAYLSTTPAPVSPTMAVKIMVPVVRALVHAHGLGLIHRDLKPANIMLGDNGTIKVLDFGIAKVLEHSVDEVAELTTARDESNSTLDDTEDDIGSLWSRDGVMTRQGAVLGTVRYMSPEQVRGDEVDARSDIWAVGIMLWELIAGRHPFSSVPSHELHQVITDSTPTPTIATQSALGSALSPIIDRCLHKDRDQRIATAQTLLDELEVLLPESTATAQAELLHVANPFAGLAAFQESDATRFFGREREIASLTAQLRSQCLITVAGPSGAGKSSFVRAGVIPALKRSGQRWQAVIARPGREPIAALAGILAQLDEPESDTSRNPDHSHVAAAGARDAVIATLRAQPGYVGAALRARCKQQRCRMVLFIDQFEELYTLSADNEERALFIRCLEGVADDAASPLRVILAARLDFLDRLAEDRAFSEEITRALVLLPAMRRSELSLALTRPV